MFYNDQDQKTLESRLPKAVDDKYPRKMFFSDDLTQAKVFTVDFEDIRCIRHAIASSSATAQAKIAEVRSEGAIDCREVCCYLDVNGKTYDMPFNQYQSSIARFLESNPIDGDIITVHFFDATREDKPLGTLSMAFSLTQTA